MNTNELIKCFPTVTRTMAVRMLEQSKLLNVHDGALKPEGIA